MTANNERRGLASTLATGVKDMPRNASWLIGKAFRVGEPPDQGDEENGDHRDAPTSLMDVVRSAGATVRDALPGGDSVEARLDRARVAGDRAHESEQDALQAAEHAAELSTRAEEIDRQERARIAHIEDEQAEEVRRRVEDARARADEQVAKEQREAELKAHDVLSQEREASDERSKGARDAAEAAQQDAEEQLRRATEQLAEARALADEAARAAEEAAANARAQAEQIAANAQRDASGAGEAVDRAVKLQRRSSRTAAKVARAVDDRSTPGRLKELPKSELVKLASAQGISGRSGMSKTQLVSALDKGKKGANR